MSAISHTPTKTPKTRRRRSWTLATLALVGGALALAFSVPTAPAATGDLVCTVAGQFEFSPPLTATNHTAALTETASVFACNSPNGQHSDIKSGLAEGTGTATSAAGLNPCSALLTIDINVKVRWEPNAGQSRAVFHINTNPSGPVTITGTVTSGVLKGDSVTFIGALVPNADCALNGLSSLTFEGEDVIG